MENPRSISARSVARGKRRHRRWRSQISHSVERTVDVLATIRAENTANLGTVPEPHGTTTVTLRFSGAVEEKDHLTASPLGTNAINKLASSEAGAHKEKESKKENRNRTV